MASLKDSVTVLPTIGPKRALDLATLNINTIWDLLTYYPFRYEDIKERNLLEIKDQEKVVLKGYVVTPAVVRYFGPKKSQVSFRMKINDAVIEVSFFNQSYLKDRIKLDQEIAIYGKWDNKRKRLSGMKIMASKDEGSSELEPVYHVNKNIKQQTLIKCIDVALSNSLELVEEFLPQELLTKYQLLDLQTAIKTMHHPNDLTIYNKAKDRLAYEEFLLFELKMQGLRLQNRLQSGGKAILYDNQKLKKFIERLPFALTAAQKKVTNEICKDLLLPIRMNRLLQGDVGSGKTVVAAICMYAVVTASKQAALMVPTEILAEQHFASLQQLFKNTGVEIALLTGSTKEVDRKEIHRKLEVGELDIIVGTHALIQERVKFKDLGFIVIDEQHRFGVKQRQQLREKGQTVDVLMMTATPIPRTLAITAYGEMDVSIINEMPKGRKPIVTKWLSRRRFDDLLFWTNDLLSTGQQMYVICPLVEESEAIDAKNAEDLYVELQQYYNDKYQVGLLHGKMNTTEKEKVMNAFQQNEIQILVSTTVVEVGVNVPNANLMIIMDADRFGLSQLHQLRGRVGRGDKQAYCYLIADPKNDLGKERMQIMTETTDGFVLSQKDLEMRGPGEFFGHRQSGMPEFKVGNIVDDYLILEAARQDAEKLWQEDWLDDNKYQKLQQHYQVKQHNFD